MPRKPPTFDPARLRELVAASGLSGRQLAAASGVDRSTLRRYCDGTHTPQADTLARVLAALGRRWADLD
jgi:transcriptional regulator with XRE-family HTH domain